MTSNQLDSMRRHLATEVMGWEYYPPDEDDSEGFYYRRKISGCAPSMINESDWLPDLDANQTIMVIEARRERGWLLRLVAGDKGYIARFQLSMFTEISVIADTLQLAVCQAAAKATGWEES